MMDSIVFWLVPVVLLIVLILLTISLTSVHRRRKLIFIEPLGSLVKGYRLVRIDGQVHLAQRSLHWLGRATIENDWLSHILKEITPLKINRPKEIMELDSFESIGPLSWRIILVVGKKRISFVIGLSRSLDAWLDRGAITTRQHLETHAKQEIAGQHGYLQLLLAEAPVTSKHKITTPVKHHLLAALIIEPIIDTKELQSIRDLQAKTVKFLSWAPKELLGSLFETVFARPPKLLTNATSLDSFDLPHLVERELLGSEAVAEAPLKTKHLAIRAHQHHYDCHFYSRNPEDKHLTTNNLT